MNAEQMFKELGYANKNTGFSNIICYEKDASIRNLNHIIGIQFVLNDEHVSMYSVFGKEAEFGAFNYLDVKLLNAINKQCKELEWGDNKPQEETNFEHYKDEILECCIDSLAVVKGRPKLCYKTNCNDCDFKIIQKGCHKKVKEWLNKPYEKPKYKLTQFEYDLLSVHKDYKTYNNIANQIHLFKMHEKGYFKGIDTKIPIREILDNCEMVG